MKRQIFFLLFLLPALSPAQLNTAQKGFQVDLGLGGTLHNIFNNVELSNGNNAFANLFHLNFKYKDGILGYGLKFEHLQFQTSNDSAVVFRNAVANILQYNTTVNLYEGKKVGIYVAAGVGVNGFHYEQRDSSGTFGQINMSGFSGSLSAGINYHFKGNFGLFLQTGYIANVDRVDEFKVNGNSINEYLDREVSDVVYTMRGIDFKVGLRYAFFKKSAVAGD